MIKPVLLGLALNCTEYKGFTELPPPEDTALTDEERADQQYNNPGDMSVSGETAWAACPILNMEACVYDPSNSYAQEANCVASEPGLDSMRERFVAAILKEVDPSDLLDKTVTITVGFLAYDDWENPDWKGENRSQKASMFMTVGDKSDLELSYSWISSQTRGENYGDPFPAEFPFLICTSYKREGGLYSWDGEPHPWLGWDYENNGSDEYSVYEEYWIPGEENVIYNSIRLHASSGVGCFVEESNSTETLPVVSILDAEYYGSDLPEDCLDEVPEGSKPIADFDWRPTMTYLNSAHGDLFAPARDNFTGDIGGSNASRWTVFTTELDLEKIGVL